MRKILVIGAALAAASSIAGAQGPGYGYGPGMMGGGYGPGMMGGGYGPGMMGGYGRGPGMMGPGASFGGTAPLAALDLTDEQRDKIAALREENRRKNWDAMGKVRSEQFKLRQMYNADNVDPQAAAEQQKKVDDLRREMLVSRLETHKQVLGVLTPEQRKQLRQSGPWWAEEDVE
jgi:Spy/CpxP family protein refolding chaperone